MTEKSTVQPTYNEKGEGSPCRLTKADIVTLEQILRTDLGEDARFNIETTLPNVELSAPTAETFFESNLLPDTLTRLYLSCRSRSPHLRNRWVYVGMSSTNVLLQVTSENSEWTIGRHAAITRFLRERRPWYWPVIKFFTTPKWMGLSILLYIIATPIAWYLGEPTVARTIIYGFMAIWWPFYLGSWLGLFAYVKVRVRPKITDHTAMQTRIGIISIIISVLALLVPLITWLIDRQAQP